MKILHITNYQVPGYGYEEIMLARAQRNLNHDVTIVASNYLHPRGYYAVLRDRFPERRVAPREEVVDGVRVLRLPSIEIGQRTWIKGLARQVRHLEPDVVHCHNLMQFHPLRIAWLKARSTRGFALVVDDHMHFAFMRRGITGKTAYFAFRHALVPLLAGQVDRYCAIGEGTRTYLRKACGIKAPIDLRPLGVDTNLFRNSPERRRRARQELGFDDAETVFIYTGKVIAPKGVHLLAAAALRLLTTGRRVRVIAVGAADSSYLKGIESEVTRAGWEKQFTFLPSRQHAELADLYAAADVAVWPRQESMAIYEALAMGLPVIVSNTSGYASTDAKLATTFAHDNAESLAGSMLALMGTQRDPALAQASRRLAEREFSWDRSAAAYLALYETILSKNGSA